MTTLPISSIAAYSQSAATSKTASSTSSSSTTSAPSPASASLANQDVFLQLLIAQLKNQDPSQPTDGTQFVTQLAQFTTLQEQTKGTSDLDAIVAALPSLTAAATSTPTTSNGAANNIKNTNNQ
jgi:flagellar basal-body rod modification protein FlgD